MLVTYNRFVLPIFEDQCSLPNREKKRKSRKRKVQSLNFALKPEHGSRGVWRKPLKPGALNLNWLGVIDLVFVTRVNG